MTKSENKNVVEMHGFIVCVSTHSTFLPCIPQTADWWIVP
jgi:hypothetical protein